MLPRQPSIQDTLASIQNELKKSNPNFHWAMYTLHNINPHYLFNEVDQNQYHYLIALSYFRSEMFEYVVFYSEQLPHYTDQDPRILHLVAESYKKLNRLDDAIYTFSKRALLLVKLAEQQIDHDIDAAFNMLTKICIYYPENRFFRAMVPEYFRVFNLFLDKLHNDGVMIKNWHSIAKDLCERVYHNKRLNKHEFAHELNLATGRFMRTQMLLALNEAKKSQNKEEAISELIDIIHQPSLEKHWASLLTLGEAFTEIGDVAAAKHYYSSMLTLYQRDDLTEHYCQFLLKTKDASAADVIHQATQTWPENSRFKMMRSLVSRRESNLGLMQQVNIPPVCPVAENVPQEKEAPRRSPQP